MADRRARRLVAAAAALVVLSACGNSAPTATTPATTEPPVSIVYRVTVTAHAGPTCPVERPGQPCPDTPVRGRVAFTAGGALVSSGELDASGTVSLELPSASYLVEVDTGAMLPRCEPVTVEVVDRDVSVDVSCDTGIR